MLGIGLITAHVSLWKPTCRFITQSIHRVHKPGKGYLPCLSTGFCISRSVKCGKDIKASDVFAKIYKTRYSRNLSNLSCHTRITTLVSMCILKTWDAKHPSSLPPPMHFFIFIGMVTAMSTSTIYYNIVYKYLLAYLLSCKLLSFFLSFFFFHLRTNLFSLAAELIWKITQTKLFSEGTSYTLTLSISDDHS